MTVTVNAFFNFWIGFSGVHPCAILSPFSPPFGQLPLCLTRIARKEAVSRGGLCIDASTAKKGFGAMDSHLAYEFMRFEAMHGYLASILIGFGDMDSHLAYNS